jgi:DivIVA domain-containing protein
LSVRHDRIGAVLTILLYLLIIAVVAALLFFAASAVFGRGEDLPPLPGGTTVTVLPLHEVTGADVRTLRFQQVVRGYKASEVDWALQRLGAEIDALRGRLQEAGLPTWGAAGPPPDSAAAERLAPVDLIKPAMPELFQLAEDSVERFFARWYGPPDQPAAESAGRALPAPLRRWYAAAGRYSRAVTSHNEFVAAAELAEQDGKLVFWVERQAGCRWSVDPAGDDPEVYERPDGDEWAGTGLPLSEFLLSVAVFEAILGDDVHEWYEDMTPAERDQLLLGLRPLPMAGPLAGGQLYAGPDVLVYVSPRGADDGTNWTVWRAAAPAKTVASVAEHADTAEKQ